MSDFAFFLPLYKVEEHADGTCTVFTRGTQEVPDDVKEIMDYETTVPEIRKWSDAVFQRSAGKSYGNIRSMHSNIASGKLTMPPNYIDAEKAVDLAIDVVDPVEAQKCIKGVYTGASMGGRYGKRWPDPLNPGLYRYTGIPSEFSLVDAPAVPTATFQMVKLDGQVELRKFSSDELELITPNTTVENPLPSESTLVVESDPNEGELLINRSSSPTALSMDLILSTFRDVAKEIMVEMTKPPERVQPDLEAIGKAVGIACREKGMAKPYRHYPDDMSLYADPANYKIPLDTIEHAKAAIVLFNGPYIKKSYSLKEQHILGRRIAQRVGALEGAKYQYSPKERIVKKIGATMEKGAMESVIGDLRSAAQSALDNISDPEAVMSALHQILAGIDVATDASSLSTSTSVPASTLSVSSGPAVPSREGEKSSTPAYEKLQADIEAMKAQQNILLAAIEKMTAQPAAVQKMTLGDLNAQVQQVDATYTPLEKAILAAAGRMREGMPPDAIGEIMKAANGNAGMAQDRAMDLVQKSLQQRGFTSQNFTQVMDPVMTAQLRAQLQP